MGNPEDDQGAPEDADFSAQVFGGSEVGGVAGLLAHFPGEAHGAGPVGGDDEGGEEIWKRVHAGRYGDEQSHGRGARATIGSTGKMPVVRGNHSERVGCELPEAATLLRV